MQNRPKITNNIRHLRFTSNEMSQNTLANRVGVTRQTIATIEKAKYYPTLELAFLISRVFDKEINEVFKFCLLYTSPSPRDVEESRMPSSA